MGNRGRAAWRFAMALIAATSCTKDPRGRGAWKGASHPGNSGTWLNAGAKQLATGHGVAHAQRQRLRADNTAANAHSAPDHSARPFQR